MDFSAKNPTNSIASSRAKVKQMKLVVWGKIFFEPSGLCLILIFKAP